MSLETEQFLRNYLPFLLVRADVLLSRQMLSELERFDCSIPEWRIVSTLFDTDQLVIGTLAELVLLPQPTVSRWVSRLAERGLVTRSITQDRRQSLVRLTDDGRELAHKLILTASEDLAAVTKRLPPHDREHLTRILQTIIRDLESQQPPPSV
jgi:DNA-binding MarR family transcriptional regulator